MTFSVRGMMTVITLLLMPLAAFSIDGTIRTAWDFFRYGLEIYFGYLILSLIALLNFYHLAHKISDRLPSVPFKRLFTAAWMGLTIFLLVRAQLHIQKAWVYLLVLIAASSLLNGLLDFITMQRNAKDQSAMC